MQQEKTYTVRPDWKDELSGFIAGAVLTPVFGIGLLIIYRLRKRLDEIRYVISDHDITLKDHGESITLGLAAIEQISVNQTGLENWFNIGRVQLETNGRDFELRGIENPDRIEKILRVAVATEKDRLRQKEKVKGDFPNLNAGSVDKVNTLVGLWQQGLIDDDEYERERKKI